MDQRALLEDSLPLVERVASSMARRLPPHVELADLTQAGFVGLLEAARRFDRQKGARFATYAELRIRGAILDSLRELDWAPRSLRRRSREIDRARRRLEASLGRAPTIDELAAALGSSPSELHATRARLQRADSVVCHASIEEIAPYTADTSVPDPQKAVLERELHALLREAVTRLPRRERLVLALYYDEELTMKEVGRLLGVNESRISQLHAKAIAFLRLHLRSRFEPLSRTA